MSATEPGLDAIKYIEENNRGKNLVTLQSHFKFRSAIFCASRKNMRTIFDGVPLEVLVFALYKNLHSNLLFFQGSVF
jgi:hypothetical protein